MNTSERPIETIRRLARQDFYDVEHLRQTLQAIDALKTHLSDPGDLNEFYAIVESLSMAVIHFPKTTD